jgi:hypothetical protein
VAASAPAISKTKLLMLSGFFLAIAPKVARIIMDQRGTLTLTPDGELPVEDLTLGSFVMTLNGARPVKRIGRTTIKTNGLDSLNPDLIPVRVAQSAITDQTPARDLYLSQEHCLFIGGILIPAKYLVNGRSICLPGRAGSNQNCLRSDRGPGKFNRSLRVTNCRCKASRGETKIVVTQSEEFH